MSQPSEVKIDIKPIANRSFTDVMKTMNTKFGYKDGKLSASLDVISVYLKGQKMLYLEAQAYCEFYLYRLMIPAIFISSLTSVISGVFSGSSDASKIVSGATALNTLILSLINYFKLDAKAEAHKMTAYSLGQLISECEFTSGKILLTNLSEKTYERKEIKEKEENEEIEEKKEEKKEEKGIKYDIIFLQNYINEIEKKVKDIKEKNQFTIPEKIRKRYPGIYNKNIFMEVYKMNIDEMIFCNQLKCIYNEEIEIDNKLLRDPDNRDLKEQKKIKGMDKNKKIEEILNYRKKDNDYTINITEEMNNVKYKGTRWLFY